MPRARPRARSERKARKEPTQGGAKPRRATRRRAKRRRSALGAQAGRILALAAAFASGCSPAAAPDPAVEAAARISAGPHEVAVLSVHELGEIRFELLPELAPGTVESYKRLAALGYFDGTTFHRVIPGFMIQGGDPNTRNSDPRDDGKGGAELTTPDEFTSYPQRRGTVSMAHRGARNTAGSQFFILHADTPALDGHYTAFGRVTRGMDVVDAITALEIDKYGRYGPRDRPYPKSAVVESVRILPADGAAEATAAAPAGS